MSADVLPINTPSRAELWRRLQLARSLLAHRANTPGTLTTPREEAIEVRPDTRPIANRIAYRACIKGERPAEILAPADRERLVYELHRQGWTDMEIAAHTRMTTYTVSRIRDRIQRNEINRRAA